jgi:glycolate oxidase FAD binding subunit
MPILEINTEDQYLRVSGNTTILEVYAELPKGLFPPFPPVELPGGVAGLVARGGFAQQFQFASEVLGLSLKTPNGKIIEAGGKVVKNVQGYDLVRPIVGSFGSLGEILEVTFRLRPSQTSLISSKIAELTTVPAQARFAWQDQQTVHLMHFGSEQEINQINQQFGGTTKQESFDYQSLFPDGMGIGNGGLKDSRFSWENGTATPEMPVLFKKLVAAFMAREVI